jgi:hypothetical protein
MKKIDRKQAVFIAKFLQSIAVMENRVAQLERFEERMLKAMERSVQARGLDRTVEKVH